MERTSQLSSELSFLLFISSVFEHSLLLSCKKEKDNKLVYKNIDYYFKDINSINVYMVEKSLTSIGETTLLFVESNKEIRI